MLQEITSSSLSLAAARWVAFDVETTGLATAGDRVVEIGAIKFGLDGHVHGTFQQLVNPQRSIPPFVERIHGISNAMVRQQPTAAQALPAFFDFLCDADAALAHNAGFDAGFIGMECARVGLAPPRVPILDTVALGRRLAPGLRSYRLQALACHLGVEDRGFHRALTDSEAVQGIFTRLVAPLAMTQTLGELAAQSQVHYFQAQYAPAETLPPGFELLDQALKAQRPLNIVYSGGNYGTQPRTITPRSLFRQGTSLLVVAVCHIDGREKHFRVDRIRQLALRVD